MIIACNIIVPALKCTNTATRRIRHRLGKRGLRKLFLYMRYILSVGKTQSTAVSSNLLGVLGLQVPSLRLPAGRKQPYKLAFLASPLLPSRPALTFFYIIDIIPCCDGSYGDFICLHSRPTPLPSVCTDSTFFAAESVC